MRRLLAWGVHLYTASGALVGALALLAIGAGRWHAAVLLMLAAMAIDATDGMLARAVDVRRVLPGFDGRRLDDMADYLNFVIVPVVFLVATGLLPHWAWAAPPVIASAYGFSQTKAKVATTDHFFTGFPSYWNIVVAYLYLLQLPQMANAIILSVLAVLVFVPIRYVYPSRTMALKWPTLLLGTMWAVVVTWMIWRLPAVDGPWTMISLVFPVYYVLLSLWLQFRR